MANTLELRPLTARSVVLSTLLGLHPPRIGARQAVRVGELFGIAEGTIRVALSRMVASGDLVQDEKGRYELTDRLRNRQTRQDESRFPRTRPWDGTWEIAVITAERRSPAERAALRQAMSALRLAELREGTWLRPANLSRPGRPEIVQRQCTFLEGRPERDPAALAAVLWDLDAWTATAGDLRAALDQADTLAEQFTVSAAVLRHLLRDPLLPPPLLHSGWPGPGLREHYERFEAAFERLLSEHIFA
ncbi:PaaX domain-containing protein, C- domain protein [Actinomadura rugatobispora]|uniref:PaaX domain-containing protein, C- domain protein n=1 Tax=Actinomadura rugatobispora TaxID=1994 RepID=A0ABW0ZXU8_9ACTN|nr:PaaX family transcriptional regulator C-terminal domain-containing protein [Actinomadura rugatobispora]